MRQAYKRVERTQVPYDANILGSHTVYRRKDDGSPKARIVPWRHRDPQRFGLRCDLPCLNPDTFRLIFSISVEKGWQLAQMDAEAAFLQAEGFSREVFVRPAQEANDPTGLWLLLAPAYGLADSGRLWYRTNDKALQDVYKLNRSSYEPTLYYHKTEEGQLDFILVFQVDIYLYSGTNIELTRFENFLRSYFKIGTLERESFSVLGCELAQEKDGSITISQEARSLKIDTTSLNTSTRDKKQNDRLATPAEIHTFRSIIGKRLYIWRLTNPILQYNCSALATKVSALCIRHLKTLKTVVHVNTKVPQKVFFRRTPPNTTFTLHALSDASMSTSTDAARSSFLFFRRNGDVVHPICWNARKLRRVALSSSTAELLAASDATNMLAYLQSLLD